MHLTLTLSVWQFVNQHLHHVYCYHVTDFHHEIVTIYKYIVTSKQSFHLFFNKNSHTVCDRWRTNNFTVDILLPYIKYNRYSLKF